jgi:hypothetical protein
VLTILITLQVALYQKLLAATFDVVSAFLNAHNDYENFGYKPVGLFGYAVSMRILKAVYGDKQAPKLWSDMLHKILTKLGFERCPVSACLYVYRRDGVLAFLCVHVDDRLLLASHKELFDMFITAMEKQLSKVHLTQPLQKYVGIEMNERQSVRMLSGSVLQEASDRGGHGGGRAYVL